MHAEISLGSLERALPQGALLGLEVAPDHDRQGDPRCGRQGAAPCSLCGRIDTEFDLREALPGDLAGVVEVDLADVTETFTPLLCPDSILHNPPLGVAAHPNAEAWHGVVPLEMFSLAGR